MSRPVKTARELLILGFLMAGCATVTKTPTLQRFEFQRAEMGMPVRLVAYAPDHLRAADAAMAAFDRIRELNGIFSDYEPDTELNRLSGTAGEGRAVPVSQDLWNVLERAQDLAQRSRGAFDITVGPYVNLWRRARRQKELPRPDLLERARLAVGYQNLELDAKQRSARLRVPNMRLDLGAIAKGYALDEAMRVLRRRGIRIALVTCGGDMRAGEAPPGKAGWQIELAPLDLPGAPPADHVRLRNYALATSGDIFQYVELNGTRYSHIVDPRTGIGITNRCLVHVIAPDGATADSLATAISVLGADPGLRLLELYPAAAARILFQHAGTVGARESPGFSRFR